jgi:hypothetical protein
LSCFAASAHEQREAEDRNLCASQHSQPTETHGSIVPAVKDRVADRYVLTATPTSGKPQTAKFTISA